MVRCGEVFMSSLGERGTRTGCLVFVISLIHARRSARSDVGPSEAERFRCFPPLLVFGRALHWQAATFSRL